MPPCQIHFNYELQCILRASFFAMWKRQYNVTGDILIYTDTESILEREQTGERKFWKRHHFFSTICKVIFQARLYSWYKISQKYKRDRKPDSIKRELSKKNSSSISKHNKEKCLHFQYFQMFSACFNALYLTCVGRKKAEDSSQIYFW